MAHPFHVGGRYRNRRGAFEVVLLDGDRMVIRYDDGEEVETSPEMQARIRLHMQAEQEAQRAEARAVPSAKSRRAPGAKGGFAGLCEHDFQRGIAGTKWRAPLGKLLRERLTGVAREAFESHAIYPRPQIHVALPEHYPDTQEGRCRVAKFVFALDPEWALYGLYIEKNNGPMDSTWHWPNLLAALAEDEALQQAVLDAMRRLGLQWEVNGGDESRRLGCVTATAEGLEWASDGGDAEAIGWPAFVQRLSQMDENAWCDLYLCARMPKAQAIAAGARIADAALQVYRALLPLYQAAVRGRGR